MAKKAAILGMLSTIAGAVSVVFGVSNTMQRAENEKLTLLFNSLGTVNKGYI